MTPARLKYSLLLGTILASGVVLLAWTQDWFFLEMTEAAHGGAKLPVAGSVAAPALPALALAGLALSAALGLAGPVFRLILGVLEIVLGASVVLAAVTALADPVAAGAPLVTQMSGVAGTESVAALVASSSGSIWPFIAIVGGVLFALVGLGIVLSFRRWPVSGRKYQTVRLEQTEPSDEGAPEDFVADWDGLSRGEDPTDRP